MVVLHFVGAGRSGSTLLNIMLDNHPDVISTGELSFFVRGWLKGDYCSCEQLVSECSFWSEVKNEWLRRTGMPDLESYLSLQKQWERYRRLPPILLGSHVQKKAFLRYKKYTAHLYTVIQELSGATVVADSSKNPVRALSVAGIPEIDLRLVFLIRDVRGYAWAKQKKFYQNQEAGLGQTEMPTSTWKSASRWIVINLLSEWVGKKANSVLKVRYEDFIDDTQNVFFKLGNLLDLDFSQLAASIVSGQTFCANHVQAGNRLRMQKNIQLKSKESWQERMSKEDQLLAWRMAGWLMKKYGYDS